MSNFNKETLEYLEKLCRIECTPEEEEELTGSMKRILDYVEQLNEIDVKDAVLCTNVSDGFAKKTLREDEIGEILPRETFLENAPDQIGGMIRVPPVMKEPA